MACSENDQSQILGYIVHEVVDNVPVLHYAYTKHSFRGLGVQKQLKAEAALNSGFYTHHTSSATKLAKSWNLVYNPYLVWVP